MNHHHIIILGSGPAGLTAAVYTARANLSPLLLHGPLPGGQLTTTTEVENYPGFQDGIMGPDLMIAMENQAKRFGCQIKSEIVTEALLDKKILKTRSNEYSFDALIIATGAKAKYIGLPEEAELMGYGVSTCATCDGAFFRGKEIAVVGGGDSACEEASFLSRFGSKVYLIHRRDELRASKIMQDRVFKNEKIEMVWNTTVSKINGSREKGVEGLTLKDAKSGVERNLPVSALFLAIGHVPNSSVFANSLRLGENGYIITKPNSTYTDFEGVFACGDVQDHVYRQAVTAAGSGCMAALDAERWLAANNVG